MNKEFFEALSLLEEENGIEIELLVEKIEQGIFKAVKKDFPNTNEENIVVKIDMEKNRLNLKINKTVVEEVEDEANEISLEDALEITKKAKVGSQVAIKLNPAKFKRIAAQSAKQSIRSDIKEIERERLLSHYQDKEHECVPATVQKVEPGTGNAVLSIDGSEAYLVKNEQIPKEDLLLEFQEHTEIL